MMLDNYLASPPTITEKLAVLEGPKKKATKIVKDKKKETKEFLRDWQASWARNGAL
jgi:hypothetical protein